MSERRVAIVYDYMTQMGGGERVIRELHSVFPDAPIYTVVYDAKALPADFRAMDIRTSFLDRFPLAHRKFELYIPLYGFAMEQFDLRAYDIVLSVSTMVAKSIITGPRTCHVSLCFTPMRWAWDLYQSYLDELRGRFWVRAGFRIFTHYYRVWDVASAERVNYFLAGSAVASRRIRKHYGRPSDVLHPPVDTDLFTPGNVPPEDFYLVVSRLVLAKRIDLVIDAFAKLDARLVVIGTGERAADLRRRATPNVTFLGFQDDDVVRDHYRRCRALIFPGEEDFGLTPVEAQACGRPVIAYAAGGALETILDGETGVLFHEQSVDSLTDAVRRSEALPFDAARIRGWSLRFGRERFRQGIRDYVHRRHEEYMRDYFGEPPPRGAERTA
ncbi:MAG: glycosyltransferase family 4 protein [Lentisphaerae bacterium]|nr:glycosyltransferase family 4 protein [Lentisphaerota bacterium]